MFYSLGRYIGGYMVIYIGYELGVSDSTWLSAITLLAAFIIWWKYRKWTAFWLVCTALLFSQLMHNDPSLPMLMVALFGLAAIMVWEITLGFFIARGVFNAFRK